MTEAAQPAAAPAAPQQISASQGAQMLAERRAASQAHTDKSEAARILAKAGHEARKQRTTEVQTQPQESTQVEGDNEQDDETQGTTEGETLTEETASSEQTDETQTDATDESQDGTIDLGDGVKVTLDQVREGFMLKADHTRKTQSLSEERKAFESERTQRLSLLDNLIGVAQAGLGQPKSMKQWLAEDPIDGMMKFAEQQERLEQFGNLIATRQQEQAHHIGQLKQATLKGLETKHGDKAGDVFSRAVQYVASKTGTDAKSVEAMLSHPEAVELVNDAMAYRELKAKEKDVTRTIAEKPKVVKPGAKVTAQAQNQSAVQNARARLKSSGSLADAVAYLQAQRKTGG
jgi:hypothetical protein